MRRHPRLLLAAVAAALTLSACSAGSSVNTGGNGNGGGKNTLVAAISAQPENLDPHKTSAYASFEVLENVYDTLVVPDPKNLTMKPSLATDWTTSGDGLTWTFTLRKGVKFQDGTSFDSADVVYSFDRIINEKLQNSYRFANVTGVKSDGPDKVQITLSKPTPNLLALIGGFKGMAILPENAEKKYDLTTQAVGTGPFKLVSSNANQTVLKAFDGYWGGKPKLAEVTFRYISEPAAALTALKNGEVQWTDNIPPQQISSLQKDNSIVLKSIPSADYWYMTMNYDKKPFGNETVRRAIATAIDRKAVTKAARFGAAKANETAIPKGNYFYYDYSPFDVNPDKAKQMLQQSGVSLPISMDLMVTDQYPETVTAAQVIASELKPIGIDVKVDSVDFSTWLDREAKGDFDAFMLGWLGNIDPYDYYYSQHITGGTNNYQHYSNPQVDRLLKQAASEPDRAKSKQLYDQAVKHIVDDVSYLYLYNPNVVQAWEKGLSGYTIRPDKAINFEDVTLP